MRSKRSRPNSTNNRDVVKALLDDRVRYYNKPEFIPNDPIAIPHRFQKRQDIEISGFCTAMLSWGLRKTILKNASELFLLMDNAPHDFILHHKEKDRARFLNFKHRTFQPTDTLYFLEFLQQYYREHDSLEDAFLGSANTRDASDMRSALIGFHQLFFDHPFAPVRTRKHISSPRQNSACKRLNMFLRWMVRDDGCGVDFGLWKRMNQSQLMIPLDVHVQRIATSLGLLSTNDKGWKAVEILTGTLRTFDPQDPVKYDFALFGMGVLE